MEFVRKKKRGQNHKVRRMWFSEEGYRIVWRKEVHGVHVPARFQACVRTLVPYSGGELRQMWDFVNHNRRLIKTLAAAQEECEKHQRLWTKVCGVTGIRALRELFGGKLPMGLPVWARKKMDRRLYAILTDNRPSVKYPDDEEDESCIESSQPASDAPGPGGPIKTSDSSVSPTEAILETATLASPAEGKAESTIRRTHRTRSKDTATSDASNVPPASEVAKARKKPAARRTGRASKRTTNRKKSTTGSSASGAKRSKGLRGMKSVPCGS